MFSFILLSLGAFLCSVQAVRAGHLLTSSLWLAGVSALVAIELYLLGAVYAAVIELSVGAGLVTVLFVFAISMAGDESLKLTSVVPKSLAATLVIAAVGLLGWLLWPIPEPTAVTAEAAFGTVLWQERALDMLLQVVLVFAGVLGLLGLLVGERLPDLATVPQSGLTPDSNTPMTTNGRSPETAVVPSVAQQPQEQHP